VNREEGRSYVRPSRRASALSPSGFRLVLNKHQGRHKSRKRLPDGERDPNLQVFLRQDTWLGQELLKRKIIITVEKRSVWMSKRLLLVVRCIAESCMQPKREISVRSIVSG